MERSLGRDLRHIFPAEGGGGRSRGFGVLGFLDLGCFRAWGFKVFVVRGFSGVGFLGLRDEGS